MLQRLFSYRLFLPASLGLLIILLIVNVALVNTVIHPSDWYLFAFKDGRIIAGHLIANNQTFLTISDLYILTPEATTQHSTSTTFQLEGNQGQYFVITKAVVPAGSGKDEITVNAVEISAYHRLEASSAIVQRIILLE